MLTDINHIKVSAIWPPNSERNRLNAFNANRRLYQGYLKEVLDCDENEVRTKLNAFRRITTFWENIMFARPPIIEHQDNPRANQILQKVYRSLITAAKGVVRNGSRYGVGVFVIECPDKWKVLTANTGFQL